MTLGEVEVHSVCIALLSDDIKGDLKGPAVVFATNWPIDHKVVRIYRARHDTSRRSSEASIDVLDQ